MMASCEEEKTMTYGITVVKTRRIVAETSNMSKEQVETFLKQTLYAGNKALNRLFANGHVTTVGHEVHLYRHE